MVHTTTNATVDIKDDPRFQRAGIQKASAYNSPVERIIDTLLHEKGASRSELGHPAFSQATMFALAAATLIEITTSSRTEGYIAAIKAELPKQFNNPYDAEKPLVINVPALQYPITLITNDRHYPSLTEAKARLLEALPEGFQNIPDKPFGAIYGGPKGPQPESELGFLTPTPPIDPLEYFADTLLAVQKPDLGQLPRDIFDANIRCFLAEAVSISCEGAGNFNNGFFGRLRAEVRGPNNIRIGHTLLTANGIYQTKMDALNAFLSELPAAFTAYKNDEYHPTPDYPRM